MAQNKGNTNHQTIAVTTTTTTTTITIKTTTTKGENGGETAIVPADPTTGVIAVCHGTTAFHGDIQSPTTTTMQPLPARQPPMSRQIFVAHHNNRPERTQRMAREDQGDEEEKGDDRDEEIDEDHPTEEEATIET
jgi:hypothetical protein